MDEGKEEKIDDDRKECNDFLPSLPLLSFFILKLVAIWGERERERERKRKEKRTGVCSSATC